MTKKEPKILEFASRGTDAARRRDEMHRTHVRRRIGVGLGAAALVGGIVGGIVGTSGGSPEKSVKEPTLASLLNQPAPSLESLTPVGKNGINVHTDIKLTANAQTGQIYFRTGCNEDAGSTDAQEPEGDGTIAYTLDPGKGTIEAGIGMFVSDSTDKMPNAPTWLVIADGNGTDALCVNYSANWQGITMSENQSHATVQDGKVFVGSKPLEEAKLYSPR